MEEKPQQKITTEHIKTSRFRTVTNVMNEIRYRCVRFVVIRTQNAMNHIHSLFHLEHTRKKWICKEIPTKKIVAI